MAPSCRNPPPGTREPHQGPAGSPMTGTERSVPSVCDAGACRAPWELLSACYRLKDMRGKVRRSVRIGILAVLAVLAVACTSSGGGQTITGPPIVSILSTQGPVNIGQNNKIEFNLLAATSVSALRSRGVSERTFAVLARRGQSHRDAVPSYWLDLGRLFRLDTHLVAPADRGEDRDQRQGDVRSLPNRIWSGRCPASRPFGSTGTVLPGGPHQRRSSHRWSP